MNALRYVATVISSLCLVFFLTSCATVTQDIKVEAQADPKVSFSGYKNYAWLASAEILYDPEGQWEPKDIDIDSEVRFIVNRELRKRGMTEVTSNPDMYIAFAAGIDMSSLDIKENPEAKEPVLANIPKAGLVIVMADAETGFLTWIGIAEGEAKAERSEEEIRTRIDYAVTQMFKRIPKN
jgi:hypothetical protein